MHSNQFEQFSAGQKTTYLGTWPAEVLSDPGPESDKCLVRLANGETFNASKILLESAATDRFSRTPQTVDDGELKRGDRVLCYGFDHGVVESVPFGAQQIRVKNANGHSSWISLKYAQKVTA